MANLSYFYERYLVSQNLLLALREKESPKMDLSIGSSRASVPGKSCPWGEISQNYSPILQRKLNEFSQGQKKRHPALEDDWRLWMDAPDFLKLNSFAQLKFLLENFAHIKWYKTPS